MTLRTSLSRPLTGEEAVLVAPPTRELNPAGPSHWLRLGPGVRGVYECAAGSEQQAMASAYGPSISEEDSAWRASWWSRLQTHVRDAGPGGREVYGDVCAVQSPSCSCDGHTSDVRASTVRRSGFVSAHSSETCHLP